ncbi:MAG: PEGA domain-containing protein [Bacteroidales bacterium]|nr:PEGA domain-containing protein [Bacteroidales bacterium]
MKRLFLLISLMIFGFAASSQTGSPLKMISFHKLPNEMADLKALKDECGRDSDLDNNKAALIRVKAQGFSEKTMQEFNPIARPGISIILKKYKDGEMWLYVSSNCLGTIVIKYKGEYEFKLPSKLEAKGVYELVLGMETGTIMVRAIPSNADIYVDNEKVGTGYASKAVSVGTEHHYKVICNDYYPKEGVVYFSQREEKQIEVELEPNFGYITIKSEPSGAEVYVDEQKVGTTPYLMKKIAIGRHTVEIRKYGYEPQADMVMIKADDVNKQFENVKLVEDKSIPQPPVAPTPVTGNPNTSVNISSSNGEFSVSSNNKVCFAKGNLQYQASTKTWRFAEHQWDMIGDANKNISSSYSGWIDLFGWGTGNNPTKSSTSSSDYSTFTDWGNNTISNGGGKSWFTLTKDEWVYVFDKRSTSSGIRYAKAIVNGVNGVILLPDNWSSSNYSLSNTNKYDAGFSSNRISQSDWTNKFEANGAVFLPAAGWRGGTSVLYVGSYGYYWSASYEDSVRAYYVYFYESRLYADYWRNRKGGQSVRLVCSAEN